MCVCVCVCACERVCVLIIMLLPSALIYLAHVSVHKRDVVPCDQALRNTVSLQQLSTPLPAEPQPMLESAQELQSDYNHRPACCDLPSVLVRAKASAPACFFPLTLLGSQCRSMG